MPDHQHHDHDHQDHDHSHRSVPLSFAEKLTKLLDHWTQHNDHHAADYRKWAQDARDNGQTVVADLLDSAAELTDRISNRFREASENVRPD
jgi:hypothetical protein